MPPLDHTLDRTILIRAPRATVFNYFTDSERFARWWGQGSTIDPRPGGAVRIRYPNGVLASGEILEIDPGSRLVFTFGYESGQPMPPGASRVTITLVDTAGGTRLSLHHAFADPAARNQHVQGWRYQLALFANVAADEVYAGAERLCDTYFALWNETDEERRRAGFAAIASETLAFRDRFSCTDGTDDLAAHVGAAQVHMPGLTLARHGALRQCQGTAVVDWTATGTDGSIKGRGTNVFAFGPDGRITSVVGFWG